MWLTLLAIGVGVLCAFAVCVSIFGGLHVAVLLFGVGLNGIAIDYCLQYVTRASAQMRELRTIACATFCRNHARRGDHPYRLRNSDARAFSGTAFNSRSFPRSAC